MIGHFALVFLGGGAGAMGRYGVTLLVARLISNPSWFPLATWGATPMGGFLIGALMLGWGLRPQSAALLLVVTGFLGGYTTFSAFSLETVRMIQAGLVTKALAYGLASVVGSVGACFLGYLCVRYLRLSLLG